MGLSGWCGGAGAFEAAEAGKQRTVWEEAPRARIRACACRVPAVHVSASGSRRRGRAALLLPVSDKTHDARAIEREAALEWSGANGYRASHAPVARHELHQTVTSPPALPEHA